MAEMAEMVAGSLKGCTVDTTNGGGIGGQKLNNSIAASKLYMGGGGGMGHANDNIGFFPGGKGAGIAIIFGAQFNANNNKIIANGGDGFICPLGPGCTDGMSGGGAGGSVFINILNVSGVSIIESKGGKGADNSYNDPVLYPNKKLGTGGGGGGGYVGIAQAVTSPLFLINTVGGISGVNTAHGNDPHQAETGQNGVLLNSFPLNISNTLFKANIDSIKITRFAFCLQNIYI